MISTKSVTTHRNTILSKGSILLLLVLPQLTLASNIVKGREIYKKHCVMCHGESGKSNMAGAANFSRGEGLFKSDYQLLDRIKKGNRACPAYLGILKEQQIFDTIAHIRTLYR